MYINWLNTRLMAEEPIDGGGGADPAPTDPPADPAPTDPPADPAPADPPADPAPADPPADPPVADWPEDWRSKISSDEKQLKTLERFASPKAMYDSYMALRQKIDSGEIKATSSYPNEGTEEEQSAWRTENGIPEKPEDYQLTYGDGLVIGEEDKELVDTFLKSAHDDNMPPQHVNSALRWYYDFQEKQQDVREQQDASTLTATEDGLRTEWGQDYRKNINLMNGLVQTMPSDLQPLFAGARLADGTALLNHPDMARWLVDNARTINPVASVVPNAGANVASAISDEIATIEKFMQDDRKAYNKDDKMQARLRDLYDARERAT